MKRRSRLLVPVCAAVAALGTAGVGTASAASAPTVATGAASAITSTTATISGVVSPNGTTTLYEFEIGTTSNLSGGKLVTTGTLAASAPATTETTPVTGLLAGTTYYYQLIAAPETYVGKPYYVYVPGSGASGGVKSFTTPAASKKKSTGSLGSKTATVKKNVASVSFKCSAGATKCSGTLSLTIVEKIKHASMVEGVDKKKATTKTVKLGSKSYSVAAGKKGTVKIKLNKAAQKLLKGKKKLSVLITAKAKTGAGFKNKKLTLKI